MMELFAMIPLTFWDLGRKRNLAEPHTMFRSTSTISQWMPQLNQNHCPGRKGIKAVAQPSVTSGRPLRSSSRGTCHLLPSSLQKWYVHNVWKKVSHDSSILWGNSCDKYDISYSLYTIDYSLYYKYADQDIKFELRRPQATSKEVQDLFRRRDGENKDYTEYENDCIIMIGILIEC